MFCVFSTFPAAAIIYQHLLFGSPVPLSRAFHKLLGNFLATSRISSNFFNSEQLLQLSSNSAILEHLLVLKLAFFPYFATFQQTIYEFPVKKGAKSTPPAARSALFQRKFKMVNEDSPSTDLSVFGVEGHSIIFLTDHIFCFVLFFFFIEDKVTQHCWLLRKLHKIVQKSFLFFRATFVTKKQLLIDFETVLSTFL